MAVKYFLAKDIVAEITAMAFNYKAVVAERDRDAGQDRITPLAVRDWLARLRLLEGVPFNTIVADFGTATEVRPLLLSRSRLDRRPRARRSQRRHR